MRCSMSSTIIKEQTRFVYEHIWRPGDIILWDNRCTLHARTDFSPSEHAASCAASRSRRISTLKSAAPHPPHGFAAGPLPLPLAGEGWGEGLS